MKPTFANKFKDALVKEEVLPTEDELLALGKDSLDDESQSVETEWKDSLDKETNPGDFNIEDNPMVKIDRAGVESAKKWIEQLNNIAEYINGTGEGSLNYQINRLEMNNSVPFKGLIHREEKRIVKVAENVRGLAEVLKNIIVSSEKKITDSIRR